MESNMELVEASLVMQVPSAFEGMCADETFEVLSFAYKASAQVVEWRPAVGAPCLNLLRNPLPQRNAAQRGSKRDATGRAKSDLPTDIAALIGCTAFASSLFHRARSHQKAEARVRRRVLRRTRSRTMLLICGGEFYCG